MKETKMANTSIDKFPIVAIITGDIVGSSKLNAERRLILYKTFSTISDILIEKYPNDISYKISNFRGGGWQLVVNSPKKSFEISLFIRTFIRFKFHAEKLDTRIAIGIGPVQFIPEDNVSAGDGPAYLISGHLLESFSTNRMGIGFSTPRDDLNRESLASLVLLLDLIISTWGPGQSQAAFLAIQGFTQNKIAEQWWPNSISQPAVSKSLKTAGWEQVNSCFSIIERLIGVQINKNGE